MSTAKRRSSKQGKDKCQLPSADQEGKVKKCQLQRANQVNKIKTNVNCKAQVKQTIKSHKRVNLAMFDKQGQD